MTADEIIDAAADAIWNEGPGIGRKLPWIREQAKRACLAMLDAIGEPNDEMCDAATRSTSAWINSKLQGVELRRLKHRIRFGAMLKALKIQILALGIEWGGP
jgi:hypothetical protein